MDKATNQTKRRLVFVALALNCVAWGGYFSLTKVMKIDVESIRQAKLAG